MDQIFQQALALHRAGRLDEAEALYRQLGDWKPEWTLHNLGVILRTTGRLDEAETVLRAAVAADPSRAHARHTLGMTLLQAGKYAEGWRFYEARRELHRAAPPPALPEWRGEDLTGQRLLVIGEQGLGDEILLSRFLAKIVASEVLFACPPSLVRLFASLPVTAFHAADLNAVQADCWTYLASVPRWLEIGPEAAPAPYLPCPVRPAAGVGLMLQGGILNGNSASRLPDHAAARAIRGLADFTDLSPEASGARDFAETAEIVTGLEQVVTVDTSVAHLAGAMGKRCWVLAARPAVDWYTRWADDRSPWYPSLRVIRQSRPGDWTDVVARLAAALGQA
jgi:tetratricopeptide (TPR) repeat protein